MKKQLSTLLLLLLFGKGFSQENTPNLKSISNPAAFTWQFPVTDTISPRNFKQLLPYNGIPNVITIKPLPPVYRGNNGKGFDRYDSPIDNMPMLVPDSSFFPVMPNALRVPGNQRDSIDGFLNKKRWYPNRPPE